MPNELIVKNGLFVQTGSLIVTGSAQATAGFSGSFSGSFQGNTFSQGGSIVNPDGISFSGSYYVWRAPFPCTVISLYGRRSGGTAPQINARRSGSGGYSLHTGSNLTLTADNTWTAANTVANTAYIVGDSLEIVISGSANTQVAVQVDYIKTL